MVVTISDPDDVARFEYNMAHPKPFDPDMLRDLKKIYNRMYNSHL